MAPLESRIKAAAAGAVRIGGLYWEALAADLDDRLLPLLPGSGPIVGAAAGAGSLCAALREFHRVSPADCLLMRPLPPGRILGDASLGLRYGLDLPLGAPAEPGAGEERVWSLRLVMIGGSWKVDPYTHGQDWG
jgi:hypothetical protein